MDGKSKMKEMVMEEKEVRLEGKVRDICMQTERARARSWMCPTVLRGLRSIGSRAVAR